MKTSSFIRVGIYLLMFFPLASLGFTKIDLSRIGNAIQLDGGFRPSGNGNPLAAGGIITVGNGGQVVGCVNSSGDVVSLEAFDLYEGRVLNSYEYSKVSSNADALAVATQYARQVDAAYGNFNEPRMPREKTIEGRLQYIAQSMIMLPPGVGLEFTRDTYEFFTLPKNCAFYQTINFRDSKKIYVNSDIWNALSSQDKAALYLHEAVYWYLRDTGDEVRDEVEQDSRRARRAVAYLFSGQELPSRTALKVPGLKKVQYCHSYKKTVVTNDWATRLLAYRDPQGKLVVQFLQIGGYRVLTQTFLIGDVYDDLNGDSPQKSRSGLDESPFTRHQNYLSGLKGQLQSPLDIDGTIQILWGVYKPGVEGTIHLSGDLQPGNSLSDILVCESVSVPK